LKLHVIFVALENKFWHQSSLVFKFTLPAQHIKLTLVQQWRLFYYITMLVFLMQTSTWLS